MRESESPAREKVGLKPAIPRAITPITMLPAMVSVCVVPMILRVSFVCVPPIVIMVREYHTRPLHFGASTPTVATVIARYVSRSWYGAEKDGVADSKDRRNGNNRSWCTHELISSQETGPDARSRQQHGNARRRRFPLKAATAEHSRYRRETPLRYPDRFDRVTTEKKEKARLGWEAVTGP